MKETEIVRIDQLVVVGPECYPNVERSQTIVALDQPVAAAGKDGAAKLNSISPDPMSGSRMMPDEIGSIEPRQMLRLSQAMIDQAASGSIVATEVHI